MRLSVIIPTLNEEDAIADLLAVLRDDPDVWEIIVVDGGSSDATRQIAASAGAHVIRTARGRGQQLCAGARAALGDIYWFLHADTRPERGAGQALLLALEHNPQAPGGNFQVWFDGERRFATWLNGFYAWLRSHGVYYGDSAIFVRRETYEALGGFRATALMEDYEFTRRLERVGPTLNIQSRSVQTSSRRFQNRSPWRIVLQWLVIHALYYCNVSGTRLAKLYQSQIHSPADQK